MIASSPHPKIKPPPPSEEDNGWSRGNQHDLVATLMEQMDAMQRSQHARELELQSLKQEVFRKLLEKEREVHIVKMKLQRQEERMQKILQKQQQTRKCPQCGYKWAPGSSRPVTPSSEMSADDLPKFVHQQKEASPKQPEEDALLARALERADLIMEGEEGRAPIETKDSKKAAKEPTSALGTNEHRQERRESKGLTPLPAVPPAAPVQRHESSGEAEALVPQVSTSVDSSILSAESPDQQQRKSVADSIESDDSIWSESDQAGLAKEVPPTIIENRAPSLSSEETPPTTYLPEPLDLKKAPPRRTATPSYIVPASTDDAFPKTLSAVEEADEEAEEDEDSVEQQKQDVEADAVETETIQEMTAKLMAEHDKAVHKEKGAQDVVKESNKDDDQPKEQMKKIRSVRKKPWHKEKHHHRHHRHHRNRDKEKEMETAAAAAAVGAAGAVGVAAALDDSAEGGVARLPSERQPSGFDFLDDETTEEDVMSDGHLKPAASEVRKSPPEQAPTMNKRGILPYDDGKFDRGGSIPIVPGNVDISGPPIVDPKEQITLPHVLDPATQDGPEFDPNRTERLYVNDNDNATVDSTTVASSTYHEDRRELSNQPIMDPHGEAGQYTGVVLESTGMPHGFGRMIYSEDGRTYEGDWRHGMWHGFGKAQFANQDVYQGEYRYDQRHGRGMYTWHDGRSYDGSFSHDKRMGKGKFTWPDGSSYEGDFVQGQREGEGRYNFKEGGSYVGGWLNGFYHGYGECHWADGRCYKGEWQHGVAHGQGVESLEDGTIRHEGLWENDEPVLEKSSPKEQ